MEFAERLINIRKEKKMSQQELANKVGIHANVLGRYERGEARPFVDMAVKLAQALGVSTDYLLGNTHLNIDTNILKKIEDISKLPEENKKQLLDMIDYFILGYNAKQTLGIK